MSRTASDIWSKWLLERRFGNDPQQIKSLVDTLYPVRDKILTNAALNADEILLDVGCGDGLIAFGALAQNTTCNVIFSDISQVLLDKAKSIARDLDLLGRCQFLNTPAEDLSAVVDESVDVVTTRSVRIYIGEKQAAFKAFFRVIRPGGRLSIFEPINRFGDAHSRPANVFWGYDVTPVKDLAQRVKDVYRREEDPQNNPMLNFDEYDLISDAEQAGFDEIHLELQVHIRPYTEKRAFETILQTAPNPKQPTVEEAIRSALTPAEANRFISFLRSKMEEKRSTRTIRYAHAYLWAVK